ncbi:MAG: hypothetical protein OXE84_10080 [Rhodobacteraceae bacterium]|nr:hypothetical protein [Paracoccaceae bacterium]MCY4326797.1 hypothetical protein [Paracoccaceae bacterium]
MKMTVAGILGAIVGGLVGQQYRYRRRLWRDQWRAAACSWGRCVMRACGGPADPPAGLIQPKRMGRRDVMPRRGSRLIGSELNPDVNAQDANEGNQKNGQHFPSVSLCDHRLFDMRDILFDFCNFDFKMMQAVIAPVAIAPPLAFTCPVR